LGLLVSNYIEISRPGDIQVRALTLSFFVSVLWISTTVAQNSTVAKPYESVDAYQIYSLLLPQEESYGFAKSTLVIQEETASNAAVEGACLSAEVANRFKGAISDYRRSQTKNWHLQRQFQIEKPYEIVDKATIGPLLKGGWDRYHDQYPRSGGYIFMSAVGFNKNKTLAIVYTGSICGGLCGRAQFHLLEKTQGHWKEVPAETCVTFS
jgi:hypothetical protein